MTGQIANFMWMTWVRRAKGIRIQFTVQYYNNNTFDNSIYNKYNVDHQWHLCEQLPPQCVVGEEGDGLFCELYWTKMYGIDVLAHSTSAFCLPELFYIKIYISFYIWNCCFIVISFSCKFKPLFFWIYFEVGSI